MGYPDLESFGYFAAFLIIVLFCLFGLCTLFLMWTHQDEDEIINEEIGMVEADIQRYSEKKVKKCYDLQQIWQGHEIYWQWYEDETIVRHSSLNMVGVPGVVHPNYNG